MNLADAAFSGLAALLGGDNSSNLCRDGVFAVLFFPELFVMFFQYCIVTLRHCRQETAERDGRGQIPALNPAAG